MKSYKSIIAWQESNRLATEIHQWIDSRWTPQRASAYEQLRRASLSVPLNIVEGYASGRGARCRFHFRIAFASAVETSAILEFLIGLGEDVGELTSRSNGCQALTFRLWQRYKPL